jgi:uncharacterized BrkB/YihY/UPF0761 family membrane protein
MASDAARRVWREVGDDEVSDRAAGLTVLFSLHPDRSSRWSSGRRSARSSPAGSGWDRCSIGGVILLMLWLYLSGVALLLGAEINAEIEHAAAARGAADAKAEGETVPGEEAA